jgi:hypothetical protein
MLTALIALLALTTSYATPQTGNGYLLPRSDTVQCANLIYAGNKTSQCFSDRFLKRLSMETRIQTEPKFRKVRLDSAELCNHPFAILTGEGGFRLTEKERMQLRYYLTHGGFLLASAGCSDPEWTRSFRSEFAKVFPGKKTVPLKKNHPIFRTIYKVESLATTHSSRGTAGATLEAFNHKGRIVMIFSEDGLNDTAHAEKGCCCCGGDEIEKSEFINANILAYALLH